MDSYSDQLLQNITFTPGNSLSMPVTVFFMRDPCLQTMEMVRANLTSSDPAVILDGSMPELVLFDDNSYSKSAGFIRNKIVTVFISFKWYWLVLVFLLLLLLVVVVFLLLFCFLFITLFIREVGVGV